jgi:hypothetical protein
MNWNKLRIFKIGEKIGDQKINSINTLHNWINTEEPNKLQPINLCDTETSDAWEEGERMTYEDSHMIGTCLWVYPDDDNNDVPV